MRGMRLARVLVAIDGSDAATAALSVAASIARGSGAALAVAHVADASSGADPAALLEQLPGEAPVTERMLLTGRTGPALTDAAQAWGADLVAAGTHGIGAVRDLFAGSTSRHLLTHLRLPLLLARRPAAPAGPATAVVALGGAGAPDASLDVADALAAALSAPLVLVHVADPDGGLAWAAGHVHLGEALRAEGERLLREAAGQASVPVETELRHGHVHDELVAACTEHGARLVVVGRGGSARHLVAHAGCPVVVVPRGDR
jgi:nucleotide-binding universal stress UspA family protein